MSGTVLGLALVCATVLTAGGTLPVCAALVASAALAGAADASALAAADTASGLRPGEPCAAAARLASAHDAELAECIVDGVIASVVVARRLGPLTLTATARAGPPP